MTQHEQQDMQSDPLLPGYSFNRYLVAGNTPIYEGGPLDFIIDRPQGMQGYIINMTVQGQGQVFQNEDAFYCGVGDLLLFPPEAVHYYGRAPESGLWHHRWVYFKPRAYWTNWLSWKVSQQSVGRMTLLDYRLISEFDGLFQKIDQTYKAGRVTSEDLAINLLEHLLIRCFEEAPDQAVKRIDPRIHALCQHLTQDLTQNMSVAQIAEYVCLSPSRLTHLFREELGVSVLRWLEDQRMALAQQLLSGSTLTIARIANQVGYEDQFYFSRVFFKHLGMSPTAFRKTTLKKSI